MAETVTAAQIEQQAALIDDQTENPWRAAAAQHLRSAGQFLRLAEEADEAARVAAEAAAAAAERENTE